MEVPSLYTPQGERITIVCQLEQQWPLHLLTSSWPKWKTKTEPRDSFWNTSLDEIERFLTPLCPTK